MKTIILIGIFGNHPFDIAREKELDRYLNSINEDDEEQDDNDDCPYERAERKYQEDKDEK